MREAGVGISEVPSEPGLNDKGKGREVAEEETLQEGSGPQDV